MANRELTIDHQLIYKDWGDGYSFRASKPKTKAGVRTIPFTENVYSDFIFLAKTGRPLMPSAVNSVIYNIIDAYNKEEVRKAKKEHRKAELLSKISAHNLRHTACSNMAGNEHQSPAISYGTCSQ